MLTKIYKINKLLVKQNKTMQRWIIFQRLKKTEKIKLEKIKLQIS